MVSNLLKDNAIKLRKEFLTEYKKLFPSIDIETANELIITAKKYYAVAPYQKHLEGIWYNGYDFSVYNDEYYFTDLWICWIKYSRKYIKDFYKINKLIFNSILDVGCGIGYSTSLLKQLFPKATVYGSNLKDTKQFNFCQIMANKYRFNLIDEDISISDAVELIFASEFFEHIKRPIDYLLYLIKQYKPKCFVIANSFNTVSVGHFKEYQYNGEVIRQENISRLFNKILRNNNYVSIKTNIFNNKPMVWIRKDLL